MNVHDSVKRYKSEGWSPIPIPPGEKGPRISGWETKDFDVPDFQDDSNVGVHLGKGDLYDVDIDDKAAVVAADLLLPTTARVSGRPSKPRSHRFYTCDEKIEHVPYHGLGGTNDTIIELRGFSKSGAPTQTVVPPSLHPSGEPIAWADDGKPGHHLKAAVLQNGVRNVAAATLLARAFPGPGHRHDPRLALAGFLLRLGLADLEAQAIGLAVTRMVNGDEADWHVTFATTLAKKKANQNYTGGRKLADILGSDGPAIISRINKWFGNERQDAIEEMNRKHFWVRIGKDDVIGREDDDHVVFQRTRALHSEYANKNVKVGEDKDGNDRTKPLFEVWLKSSERRSYRKVVFAPPPVACDPRDYNLWRGFAVKPAPGAYPRWTEHLREVICAGDSRSYGYLIKLLGYTFRCPGLPSEVATVLRGEPGTGKGTFVRAIMKLFGPHAVHLSNRKHLVGSFNAQLSGKVIVFADEAIWAGSKDDQGALKRLITEPTLTIERKGIDAMQERNCVHLFVATNEDWAIPAMLKERRYFALNVSNKRRGNQRYFQALEEELSEGGLVAFLYDLLHWPVRADDIRVVPRTPELRVQQERSLSPEHAWWQTCLEEGKLGTLGWPEHEWLKTSAVHQIYLSEVGALRRPVKDIKGFGSVLGKFMWQGKAEVHRFRTETARAGMLRSLEDARRFFDRELGTTTEWPEATVAGTLDF